MKTNHKFSSLIVLALLSNYPFAMTQAEPLATSSIQKANTSIQNEYSEIAKDFYVYSYPFVLQEISRRQAVNVPKASFPFAPMGQFAHAPEFFDPNSRVIVRPNADTLYSTAWIDVGPEPVVLKVPATDRYFVIPLHSMWSDVFASVGTRVNGDQFAANYLIVSPTWKGAVPANLKLLRAPTNLVVLLGRTKASPEEYDDVHRFQQNLELIPFSQWGKPKTSLQTLNPVDPKVDMKTPPPVTVNNLSTQEYLDIITGMWKDNPPGQYDYPILLRAERLGIVNGEKFDLTKVSPDIQKALEHGFATARQMIDKENKKVSGAGSAQPGDWVYTTKSGAYGVDYLYRAAIAACCLGQLLPEDAIYPSVLEDADGKPLDGKNKYVLHFDKDSIPPVSGFWSITAYDNEGYFIKNPIDRFVVRDRDPLQYNKDGSLDIYIQSTDPKKGANWLPVAQGPFNLMMRLYSAKQPILDGSWTPPKVKMVK